MTMLIIPQALVPSLLPMDSCIEVMAGALTGLAKGEAVLPLRSMVWMPDRSGLMGLMPAYLGVPASLGLKVISYLPANHGTERDSHQGAVLLFDTKTGGLLAVIDASSITAIRTAAVSGLATRLLAQEEAGDLAILGSGVQAESHLDAMAAVRKLRRVRVWSIHVEAALAFAKRCSGRAGVAIEPVPTAESAVEGADLICTTTASPTPILLGEWIAPGAHVNAVGACFAANRELDTAAVVRSRLFVDRRESALAESGDILIPIQEGAFDESHIVGELGDVLLEKVPPRTSKADVTLFKSLGIAIEDLAAAHHIHARARAEGKGIAVDFGGHRRAP
jgi:ornithine cyclodeaminase